MFPLSRSARVGVASILCAAVVRLGTLDVPGLLFPYFLQPNRAAFAIYTQTGQAVRSFLDFPGESAAPVLPDKPLPVFTQVPQVLNYGNYDPDFAALLARPLSWDLFGRGKVLILSTHTSECYTKDGEDFPESAAWRTLDEGYNMLSIGDRVERLLERAGIGVIRDRTVHDYPSYNGSYGHARESLAALLAEHPGVELVLDLHRDAADTPTGQMRTLCKLNGQDCAQLMVVLGGGDHWQENLSLGLKLCAQLEQETPGILRPLLLRKSSFNQDLGPRSLLIEVGAAGNNHQEALLAAEALAEAIVALARGTGEGG